MLTLDIIKQAVIPLAEKYNIEKVDLFGSYASGSATEKSDADFLVKFKINPPSIFKVMGFKEELANSLKYPVDVVTLPITRPDGLNIDKVINVYENKRDIIHIERIKEELSFIENTLGNKTKEIFMKDDIIQHAVSMSLITIGECANHLSEEFKKKHSQIEWIQIIAVRNIAAHGYWQLNMEQIWQAAEEDIPALKKFFDRLQPFTF